MTLGINDSLLATPTPVSTFESGFEALLKRVQVLLSVDRLKSTTIIKLMPNTATKIDYNTAYDSIAARSDNSIRTVSTADLAVMGDTNHWNTASMGTIASRLIDSR